MTHLLGFLPALLLLLQLLVGLLDPLVVLVYITGEIIGGLLHTLRLLSDALGFVLSLCESLLRIEQLLVGLLYAPLQGAVLLE